MHKTSVSVTPKEAELNILHSWGVYDPKIVMDGPHTFEDGLLIMPQKRPLRKPLKHEEKDGEEHRPAIGPPLTQ